MAVVRMKWSAGGSGASDSFLLACRFFDKECAGWLEAEDLEEIAYMVSDSVSRKFYKACTPDKLDRLGGFYGPVVHDNASPLKVAT